MSFWKRRVIPPPQVDISVYSNKEITAISVRKGEKRSYPFLAPFRLLITFSSMRAQHVIANDQRNDQDKTKSGKKKSDKNKSKPGRQGDREQQEQQKPKTKGWVPALSFQRAGNTRLMIVLKRFCRWLFFLYLCRLLEHGSLFVSVHLL